MSGRPPSPDPFVHLADDAVQDAAVRARSERRGRQQRATEVATWIGTLRDLAERRIVVSLRVRSGRVHRGTLVAVARDHVAVRLAAGRLVFVALPAVRTVRPEPGEAAPPAMGDRDSAQDRTLGEVVARLAEDRAPVVLGVRDLEAALAGEVVGLGEDVLTLRVAGADRATVYLPLDILDEVAIDP